MYILRLGSVPKDNKVEQIKKFRHATGLGLRTSKGVMDELEKNGKVQLTRSLRLNLTDVERLKIEGFQIGTTMPEHLFYIEE